MFKRYPVFFIILIPVVVAVLISIRIQSASLTIDIGSPGDTLFINHFFATETNDTTTFRWSSPDAQVRVHGASGGVAALHLRVHGDTVLRSGNRQLWVKQRQRTLASFDVQPGWRVYRIVLPQGTTTNMFGMAKLLHLATAAYCPPQHDSRVLGVPVDWLRLVPLPGAPPPLLPGIVRTLLLACGTGLVSWLLLYITRLSKNNLIARKGAKTHRSDKEPNTLCNSFPEWGMKYLAEHSRVLTLLIAIGAHLVLFAPLSVHSRGVAALVVLALPGVVLAQWWLHNERDWLVRVFLASCGGITLPLLVVLALHALPGPLPWWLLLLVCDGIVLVLTILIHKQSQIYRDGHEDGHEDEDGADHCASQPAERTMIWLLVLAVLLAAALRVPFLGTSEFEGDEARAMLLAVGAMHGEDDIVLLHKKGPVEILLPLGPMVLTGQISELVARLPLALASLATLPGIYLLARRFSFRWAGVLAAFIVSVDGFLIAYARILQYQSIVVLMMVGAVWCLWRVYEGASPAHRYLVAAAVLAAVGLLAHYDYIFVLPVLAWLVLASIWHRQWNVAQTVRVLALPMLVGGGILASFYVPFVLHENFQGTLAYIGQRTGQHGQSLFNNLPSYYTIATFYNTTYQMNLLGGVVAVAVGVWLVRYGRPRSMGWVLAVVLLAGCGVLLFAPDWFVVPNGTNLAIIAFVLPLAGIILSPATPAPLRVVLLWFAVPFTAEAFLITDPRTHFYSMDVAGALLVGLAITQTLAWLRQRQWAWVQVPLALVGAVLLGVAAWYSAIVFVRQMPEYKRMFPAARPDIYRASYGDELPSGGHYGHPHRDGWKAIGDLYRRGVFRGDYYSNQMDRISAWYTRGAFRCSEQPAYYFLGTWAASESDMAIPTHIIRTTYGQYGCVLVDNMNMMDVYSREPVAHPPQPIVLRDSIASFDEQPLSRFPIQQPLALPLPQHAAAVQWQQGITLQGYDIDDHTLVAERPVTLVLSWHLAQPVTESYMPVVELHNEQGTVVATAQPLCGGRVLAASEGNVQVETPLLLQPPVNLAPGSYTLVVGLRATQGGNWLPLHADGAARYPLTLLKAN